MSKFQPALFFFYTLNILTMQDFKNMGFEGDFSKIKENLLL